MSDLTENPNFSHCVHARLQECFDSYVVVGFPVGCSKPVAIFRIEDTKSGLALNAVLPEIRCPIRSGEQDSGESG